jgi:hypothetical protein
MALYNVVTHIERAVEHKEIVLEGILDVEAEYDQTSFEATASVARRHGVKPVLLRWINSMLKTIIIGGSFQGDTLRISTTTSCLQGGVYHTLLWTFIGDELLRGLNESGCFVVGYTDDITILINGEFLTLSQRYCRYL